MTATKKGLYKCGYLVTAVGWGRWSVVVLLVLQPQQSVLDLARGPVHLSGQGRHHAALAAVAVRHLRSVRVPDAGVFRGGEGVVQRMFHWYTAVGGD